MKLLNRFFLAIKFEFYSVKTPLCGFRYAVRKWFAVITNSRSMKFLGGEFYYEDRLNPFTLFNYVNEILYFKEIFNINKPNKILDVGANIGIWGYVFSKIFPEAKIYSFEPNLVPYKILSKNSFSLKNWKIYNFGIGPTDEERDFYYVDGKSGQGSIFKENASLNLLIPGKISECKIVLRPLINLFISEEFGDSHFDLIKIDTEGAESLVIDSIKNLTWDHMYIELSIHRLGAESLDQFFSKIKIYWPNAKIMKFDAQDEVGDLFLTCI